MTMPNPPPELREALKKFKKPFRFDEKYMWIVDSNTSKYAEGERVVTVETTYVSSLIEHIAFGNYLAACLNEAAKEKEE